MLTLAKLNQKTISAPVGTITVVCKPLWSGAFHFLTLCREKKKKKNEFKVNSLSQRLQMWTAGRKSTLTQAIFWETTQNFRTIRFLITILFTYHHSQKSNEGHDAQLQEVNLRTSVFGAFFFSFFAVVLLFLVPCAQRLLTDKVILICSLQQNVSLSRALPRARPRGVFVKTANSSDNIIMIMVIRLILLIVTRALWAPITVWTAPPCESSAAVCKKKNKKKKTSLNAELLSPGLMNFFFHSLPLDC